VWWATPATQPRPAPLMSWATTKHTEQPQPGRPRRTLAATAACDVRALFAGQWDLALAEQGVEAQNLTPDMTLFASLDLMYTEACGLGLLPCDCLRQHQIRRVGDDSHSHIERRSREKCIYAISLSYSDASGQASSVNHIPLS